MRATSFIWLALIATAACGPMRKRGGDKVTLAVLPAESTKFPATAKALTESLNNVTVSGVDRKEVAKVSLEVVQLSIECVDATAECYERVGKSLEADRLLFAELAARGRKVRVTVTLFDVNARAPKRAERVFANDKDAAEGVADLVAEAVR